MSTHSEQYPSYEISISQGSKAPDDHTLVGSGDLIVCWPDGRARRYRNTGEISDCLALPYRPGIDNTARSGIDNAIRTGQTMATMVPFELSYLPTEGPNCGQSFPGPSNVSSGFAHDTRQPVPSTPTKNPDLPMTEEQHGTESYSDSASAQPVTASSSAYNRNRSNKDKAISVFARNTTYRGGDNLCAGTVVPGRPDIVEFVTQEDAVRHGCNAKYLGKDPAKKFNLVYSNDKIITVVISKTLEGCKSETAPFGRKRFRPAKHKIWADRSCARTTTTRE